VRSRVKAIVAMARLPSQKSQPESLPGWLKPA
jgi:hypothetical protein